MKLQASDIPSGKPQTRKRSPKFLPILIFFILIFTLYFPFFPKKLALPFNITNFDNAIILPAEDKPRRPEGGKSAGSNPPPPPTAAKADSTAQTPEKKIRKGPNSDDPGTTCDLFSGEWVPNPGGPYYTNTTCQTIQEHQNCMKFGRPDTGFMKWRWRPDDCELPIFDPHKFLELVKGKSLGFVGDSVARNHMQSLICLLSQVTKITRVSSLLLQHNKRAPRKPRFDGLALAPLLPFFDFFFSVPFSLAWDFFSHNPSSRRSLGCGLESLDWEKLRPYFSMPRVMDGLFSLAKHLFGIDIEHADGIATVWNTDVRFYRINDSFGTPITLFYFDIYYGPSEKRGAWMDEVVGRSRVMSRDGCTARLPVAHMVCNQMPSVGDKPSQAKPSL